jgi:hypothetical protein
VIADAGSSVEESNEDDNRAFRPFQATGLADLVLTAADVVLDPGYPRAGEAVTIQATVRNLGSQPSAATSLRAIEGRPDASTVVGVVSVPALDPATSTTVSLPWTPSSPPGDRPLVVEVDHEVLVVEQDEGNNTAGRSVVVQDDDVYLTEPYFSPNGDGMKDETTVAWRTTGGLRAEVSNARGHVVRVLAADGAPSGSATWDGRDDRGIAARDGSYTLTLTSEDGTIFRRVPVVVDTNRNPIHDALGPGEASIRNVTCSLPESVYGSYDTFAWTPGEDEALFVVSDPQPGFPIGLLRLGLDGRYGYVVQDDWYREAYIGVDSVSPDGREMLVTRRASGSSAQLYLVDLATGGRRSVGAATGGSWSPDGQFILSGNSLLTRDGEVAVGLCPGDGWPCAGGWVWSPTADRLAGTSAVPLSDNEGEYGAEVTIVARDGTPLDRISLPFTDYSEFGVGTSTVWRGDGKIVAGLSYTTPNERRVTRAFVVDPATRAVTPFAYPWWDEYGGSGAWWSPDGSRYMDEYGRVWLQDGTPVGGPVVEDEYGLQVSPHSSLAFHRKWNSGSESGVCGGKYQDIFVVSPLANLTAALEVARLPGNTGLLVKGTAADRNFERFQLDYASREDLTTWHPIGTAFDVPVVDDVFTPWAAPTPGTYVLRLSVQDRAGNAKVLSRIVSWDRVPPLANFSQSEYFLSPNGDQVKDEVVFRYLVLEPTRLEVRIAGPKPTNPGSPPAREVRRVTIEYSETGPQSFTWDGRARPARSSRTAATPST